MKHLLLLTSYPLVEPKHGGQYRALNIEEKFKASGWSVTTLSVFEEESYGAWKESDIPFPKHSRDRAYRGNDIPFIADLQTSKFLQNEYLLSEVLNRLPRKIDVIFVEQPWLWPLAIAYKERVFPGVILCYGAANIEFNLKERIFLSMTGNTYKELMPSILGEIKSLEMSAVAQADLVVSVSQAEADVLLNWGAKKLCIAPNGVAYRLPKADKVAQWQKTLGNQRFLLYIASAHPPNFSNFSQIMGGSLACFPPPARLVVVGSVAEHIYHQSKIGVFGSTNLTRLNLLFSLEEDDLDAVKHLAHGFLLPIPFGGGTNLKTAEALLARKYVVATRDAMRGFENYIPSPELFVCETPSLMHCAVRQVLLSDPFPVETIPERNELTWSSSLQPIIDALSAMEWARK